MNKFFLIRKAVFSLMISAAVCITAVGCTKKLPDTYVSESDYQYYQLTAAGNYRKLTYSEDGCYLYHERFVYHYDQEKEMIMPLCSKANCLHDAETDEEKRKQCNAYLPDMSDAEQGISVFGDDQYVYLVYAGYDSGNTSSRFRDKVYRISKDGSNRDLLISLDQAAYPILHRGFLYYYSESYDPDIKEGSIDSDYSVRRISVNRKKPKEEIIFSLPEGAQPGGIGNIIAYGNHVYFTYDYTMTSEGKDSYISELYIYDTETRKTDVMNVPKSDGSAANILGIFNDRLWFWTYDSTIPEPEAFHKKTTAFTTDLKGEDLRETAFEVEQGWRLASDGKYLYTNNALIVAFGDESQKLYQVYDHALMPLDTFTLPESVSFAVDMPVGNQYHQFLLFDDGDSWGLDVWDKSSIGSLNGAAFEQKHVIYQ